MLEELSDVTFPRLEYVKIALPQAFDDDADPGGDVMDMLRRRAPPGLRIERDRLKS